jgi:predicted lipoprotein with Yx(FWY)xxD motif
MPTRTQVSPLVRSLECDSFVSGSLRHEMTLQTKYVLGLALAAACSSNNDHTTADAGGSGSDVAAITLSTAGGLGAHLVDSQGKTLYFFANDVEGANASTYTGAAWPAFDVQTPTVGDGLTATDFSRFDRGGGTFQTTWKGRPLYYYAADTTTAPTSGEGIGGRWFVARAYDVFFGASSAVTPQGGSADAPFLTDAAGLTLYVFAKDTPATSGGAATSACAKAPCSTIWPLWQAPASLSDLVLPSTMASTNLTSFASGSNQQFAYMGWPLYFYESDTAAGDVAGAAIAEWYTVDGGWDGTMAQ